jgi:hypothetical protein
VITGAADKPNGQALEIAKEAGNNEVELSAKLSGEFGDRQELHAEAACMIDRVFTGQTWHVDAPASVKT